MRPAVRPARPGDLDEVAGLDRTCFGAAAWSGTVWSGEFGRQDREILVADEGRLVGYLDLLVPPVVEDPVELLRVAVDPAERRSGIGRQLVTAALDRCAGRTVLLEVAEGNHPARELYRAFGFVEISRRRGYYQRSEAPAGGEDAVIMRWQEEQ